MKSRMRQLFDIKTNTTEGKKQLQLLSHEIIMDSNERMLNRVTALRILDQVYKGAGNVTMREVMGYVREHKSRTK